MKNKVISIKVLNKEYSQLVGKQIVVRGWIRSIRKGKENCFVNLNDGTNLNGVQLFFSSDFSQKDTLESLNFGSSIEVKGFLKLTPAREQSFEIFVSQINSWFLASSEYPLQKKLLPLDFVRDYQQFRARTNYFSSVFRLRSLVSSLINDFFNKNDFYYVNTPIITSNDAEGGGESFLVSCSGKKDFFGRNANLTVSGQLHEEALAQGLGRVYNFSPCFRAENSNTTRHLAEFWMVEAEATFFSLSEIINLSEKLIKFVIKGVLKKLPDEIRYFEKFGSREISSELKSFLSKKFPRVKYTRCVKILLEKKDKDHSFFEFNEIFWGMDFKSEHEKFIADYFQSPVFVTDYPSHLKAFYMKVNSDDKTVACFDLLFPKIGEMIGGSVREDNYQVIRDKASKLGLDEESLSWYLGMRKEGYSPSAGFGLGLERFLMFLTKTDNIRDVIPFPRSANYLNF